MAQNKTDTLGKELRDGLRKVLAKTMVLRGAVGLLSLVAFAGWIALAAVLWVAVSRELPVSQALVLSRVVLVVLGFALVLFVLVPLVRIPSLKSLASELERRRDFQDLVTAGYEFSESDEAAARYSPELIREVIRRAVRSIEGLQVRFLFIERRQTALVPAAYAALVVLVVWAIASPGAIMKTLGYVMDPRETGRAEREANLFLTPGDITVLAGSNVEIVTRDFGGSEAPVTVSYTVSNGFWKTETTVAREAIAATPSEPPGEGESPPDAAASAEEYVYGFADVRSDVSYYAERGGRRTPAYTIHVVHKPVVAELVLVLTPPRYTGEAPDTLVDSGGNLSVLEGTRVELSGTANNALAEARLVFDGEEERPASVDERRFKGEFMAARDGTYSIVLEDTLGHSSEDPVVYTIDVFEDRAPIVDVLEPGDDALLPRNLRVDLGFSAADDYGLQGAAVWHRKGGGDERFQKTNIPLGRYAGSKELLVGYEWSLEGLTLFPGEYVEYYVEVTDNNVVTGPGAGKSPVFRISVPTMAELYDRAREESDRRTDVVEEALREGEALKERVEKLAQEMKKTEGVDWSRQKEIDKAIASQEKIQDLLQDVQKSLDETLESLSDNRMTSQEIGEKIEEINRLIEEINNDALNKYIEEMREAMTKLDPEQIRQAMENMNTSAEDLLKSLERTEGLLKQIQREQEVEELVRKAKDLLEAQEALSDSTARAADEKSMDALAREQETLAEQAAELEKELDESSKELDDRQLAEQLQKASEENSMSRTSKEMREATNQLQEGQKKQAMSHQEKAMENLIGLFRDLTSMQMQMQANASNRLSANLQRLANNTLELSHKQESLTGRMRERVAADTQGASAPAVARELAEEQQMYARAVDQIADELFEMAKESPLVPSWLLEGLGSCRQSMENSLLFLEQNKPFIGATNGAQATTKLNEVTMGLLRTCNNCSGSGSGNPQGSPMLQRLLSGQQQVLKETEHLMAMRAAQERLMQEMQADVQRLAGEQRSLREIAEKIGQDLKENERVLGRMDKITEEMDEVIKDLESGELGGETLRRQERILSRLLDAQRSIHSRDYEKDRMSKTAEDIYSEGGGSVSVRPASQMLREEIRRAMALKAPGEYEELIRMYFRALAEETQAAPEGE
jgi:hypothetical protein